MTSADGAALLTTDAASRLLHAAVSPTGGLVKSWRLDHVDADPGRSTTATYRVDVQRGDKTYRQTIGCTIRATGPNSADRRARLLTSGPYQVATWVYPDDPDLPGLRRAATPSAMAALLRDAGVAPLATGADLQVELIGYRPRRRAVLRVRTRDHSRTVYVKVLRANQFEAVLHRHRILSAGGVPSPRVLATTDDRLLVIAETPGVPLARAVFGAAPPVSGEQIVDLLDSMPAAVAELERRPPWASSVRHYAGVVEAALPDLSRRLARLSHRIDQGLAPLPLGDEPTHGDFYEAQVFVDRGRISGLIDVDTIGPGRRADDLACLVAHLNCIQRMNAAQARQITRLLAAWTPVFDRRVDPVELRLRAAAVVISLATGPYRGQEAHWQRETAKMVTRAEDLVAQAETISLGRYAYA
ncbi:MAG: phosphotransferase [Propionibacteriaceae bacterium]|jgi:Ser/Thr protein kinase RdoA (MazF antagonist)|nr:phosphotransferase [Propionibacteriaceae bacterium]